jgi:hypothetical protein
MIPLGDIQKINNPKGITALGLIGEKLNLFTGTFRGGRNESFVYGIDKSTK